MILTLRIRKAGSGRYTAEVLNGREEVGELESGTIASVIRQCADVPMPDLLGFHIWYEHVSIGTTRLVSMRHDSETLAQRLLALHAHFFGLHEFE